MRGGDVCTAGLSFNVGSGCVCSRSSSSPGLLSVVSGHETVRSYLISASVDSTSGVTLYCEKRALLWEFDMMVSGWLFLCGEGAPNRCTKDGQIACYPLVLYRCFVMPGSCSHMDIIINSLVQKWPVNVALRSKYGRGVLRMELDMTSQ